MTIAPVSTNGGTPPLDVLRKSVTAGDYNDRPMPGAFHFVLPAPLSTAQDLPAFWSINRDWILYSTLFRESMWQAALSIAITKKISRGWDVKSDVPLRRRRAQQLFINFDLGRGMVSGLQRHLQSYLLTGNGAPIEIVRATGAAGSRILGLVPLDTFRTIRTGDPDVPVIYCDRFGRWHEMRDYEVILLSDMPDQSDTWYGIGHCAAERAYRTILKLEAIERYVYEKVSGQRALSIYFVNGVMPDQVKQAVDTSKAESQAKGVTTYLGATIVPLAGDIPVQLVEVPLAELPDGFNRKEEWDIALTTFARCIGIAVQDLQPLSGQGLGTGAQTQILDEAAKGQGLAGWDQDFEHAVNEQALDDSTTFYFDSKDIRDQERLAKVRIDEETAIEGWTRMGLTPAQAINLGVDRDQLPPEYRVEGDLTPVDTLSEDEKPDQVQDDESEARADTEADVNARENVAPKVVVSDAPAVGKEWAGWAQAAAQMGEAARQQLALEQAHEQAALERQEADTAAALGMLAQAIKDAPSPVINVAPPDMSAVVKAVEALATREQPAPVVNIPAPIVNVAAPVITPDPAVAQALKELQAPPDDRPRVITVLEREADGSPKRWRDSVE